MGNGRLEKEYTEISPRLRAALGQIRLPQGMEVTSLISGPHAPGSAHFAGNAADIGLPHNMVGWNFVISAIRSGLFSRIGSTADVYKNEGMQRLAAEYGVDLFHDEGTGFHAHLEVAAGDGGSGSQPSGFSTTGAPGMLKSGNINIHDRPRVPNPDGSISTVRSGSFELPDEVATKYGLPKGSVVLLPTVLWNPDHKSGRIVTPREAFQHFLKTGENLGFFSSNDQADSYSKSLHNEQDQEYNAQPGGK